MLRITSDARPIDRVETKIGVEREPVPARTNRDVQPSLTKDVDMVKAGTARIAQRAEIDAARVLEIRNALEAGELPFDAGKIARLMSRYHGRGA
ncbi:flagellar biosynthesis anti-sigma factor FlgM [Burkholderia ubonensis]|uniref:flagellar biosynthesis anti-sigma factor FlgM n=1 Tax=Burkholderia ubonensis TaxID=101571 RepID=UPI00075CB7A3|nr:flagellar biosynthesis anti-sigma factor FlgM [Burkholderia ubonensis]